MRNGMDLIWIRRLLLAALIIGIVMIVLFGKEIMAWLLQGLDASVESELEEILR